MKIAIIGWGSLLRHPRGLPLASKWHSKGPQLPIEFSRLSSRNRLTLVIDEKAPLQPSYWALCGCEDLPEARKKLHEREGTLYLDRIHLIDESGKFDGHKEAHPITQAIGKWISASDGIDAAIWTGLGPKWPSEQRKRFGEWSHGAAIAYLHSLIDDGIHRNAELYFRHAPPSVDTELRRNVEEEFGWVRESLPEELLELT